MDDTAWAALLQVMRWFDPVKSKWVDVAVGGGFDICGERPSSAALEILMDNEESYQRIADFPDEEFRSPTCVS